MREVDRIMIEDLGIELMQMMENAGRNLAALALRRFKPASAIVLAGLLGLVLTGPATRTLATPDPWLPHGRAPPWWRTAAWGAVVGATRLLLVFLRAIPEYVWAFLLLTIFGPTAWPAVLALALHNAGILGRLGADTLENVDAVMGAMEKYAYHYA